MRKRISLEGAAIAAVVLLCAAFIASFIFGLRAGDRPSAAPAAPDTTSIREPRAIGRLEVLNASGRSGMARFATGRLRDAGFDVLFYGNAPASAGDSSVVLDRTGTDDVARAAARALGIATVRTQRDTTLYLDATVIVGADWLPQQGAAPAGRSAWRRALDRLRPDR